MGNKVSAMTLAYATKLGLKVWPTDVEALKIDSLLLRTYEIVNASFQVLDKLDQACFF